MVFCLAAQLLRKRLQSRNAHTYHEGAGKPYLTLLMIAASYRHTVNAPITPAAFRPDVSAQEHSKWQRPL